MRGNCAHVDSPGWLIQVFLSETSDDKMWTTRANEDLPEAEFYSTITDFNVNKLQRLGWFRAGRWFLRVLCRLDGINVTNIDEKCKPIKRFHCLAALVRVYMFIVTVKLVISTYNSYQFDFNLFRYNQYLQSGMTNNQTGPMMEWRIEEARNSLTTSGVMYQDLSFFIEIWNIFLISTIIFLDFALYFAFSFFIDIHNIPAGIMMDFESLKRSYLVVVLKQVRGLIDSSKNFHQECIKHLNLCHPTMENMHLVRSTIAWHENQHHQLVNKLRTMLLGAKFGPLTWTYEWLACIGLVNSFMSLFLDGYAIGLATLIYIGLPMWTLRDDKFTWWMLVETGDVIVLFLLTMTVASFHIPGMITSHMDHIRHINRLLELIKDCRLENNTHFEHILHLASATVTPNSKQGVCMESKIATKRTNQWNMRHLASQLNDNLLFVLVHYRISVSMSKSLGHTTKVTVAGAMILFFVLPVVFLVHEPYIGDQLVRYIYTFICIFSIFAINFMLIPPCHLHSRSFALYRAMSGLLAHSIQGQSGLERRHELAIYDNHLVSLLRRELDDPDRINRDFTISVLGVHVTYSTAVRIHFWFGLIMLAVINGVTSRKSDLFGHFFGDFFGLMDV